MGGHSFFSDMGNDPLPSEEMCREIVGACLDRGITGFDTTHQPERLALGKVLKALDRRDEAKIFAWNFLQKLKPEEKLDRPVEYEPHHLDQLLEELQTDSIDFLVLHDLDEGADEQHQRQEALAETWVKAGTVKTLGVWEPGADLRQRYEGRSAFTFTICPYSIVREGAAATFAAAKELGWENYACSPFVRGWELDKLVEKAVVRDGGEEPTVRAKLADRMLRYSLYHPCVDRLITAIRRLEWIQPNVESAKHGPLTETELAWLQSLATDSRDA